MHTSHRTVIVIAAQCCAVSAFAQTPQQQLDAQFSTLLTSEYTAIANGDTARLSARLADDLAWVGWSGNPSTKAQLLAGAAHVQTPIPRFEIDSLHVTLIAGVAIAEYRRIDHRDLGAYRTRTTNRVLDIFRKQNDSWLLARHTQTWIVSSPPPVKLDSATLDAFVGRYQIGPGYVDDVHWHDGHLVAQSSVESDGATLVPVSNTAFSPDGIAPIIVFERNAAGDVTGYVQQIPDGRVIRARRLPAMAPSSVVPAETPSSVIPAKAGIHLLPGTFGTIAARDR
jgi:ketosteroid isomerase-like protein